LGKEGFAVASYSVTVQQLDGGTIHISVTGALDLAHAYRFDETIRRVEHDRRPSCLVVDLSDLEFIDTSGIARLVAARRRARLNGHRLALVRGTRVVQRIFSLAAIEEAFEFVPSPDAVVTG
jgi:anti-anti-sigma factor